MEIAVKQLQDGIRVVSLEGEMDLYNASDFKNQINQLFASGSHGIVIDLDRLEYIDSSGISAMLYTFTQCKNRGIGLCFINIKGSVRKVIELTSLSGFFPIAEDLSTALGRIKANR